jgi:ribosome-binding ATPase YchF (GTP1/OBG family)
MSNKKNPVSSKITTIKLLEETKLRLEKLREYKRESYNDILKKMLYVLNVARDDPEKAKRVLEKIDDLRNQMLKEELQQKEELEKEKLRK